MNGVRNNGRGQKGSNTESEGFTTSLKQEMSSVVKQLEDFHLFVLYVHLFYTIYRFRCYIACFGWVNNVIIMYSCHKSVKPKLRGKCNHNIMAYLQLIICNYRAILLHKLESDYYIFNTSNAIYFIHCISFVFLI